MSDLRKAAKEALSVLKAINEQCAVMVFGSHDAEQLLKEALEQPQQEPVAYAEPRFKHIMPLRFWLGESDYTKGNFNIPLYPHQSSVRRPSFKVARKILNPYMMEHEIPATWLFELLDDYADACNIPKEGD